MDVCAPDTSSAPGCQKRAMGPLESELQMVVCRKPNTGSLQEQVPLTAKLILQQAHMPPVFCFDRFPSEA